jgi:2-hydroxy-3-oxopropionate reductase
VDIGFIGLGLMGRPMAANLIAAGHSLYLHRVKPASSFLVESGGQACDSARTVASKSEVIIVMVGDTPDVEDVLFGTDGVADGIEPGKLVIDMSSISPVATKDFGTRIEALGADYLDAPVSGGDVGAREATLSIMVGGKPEVFERAHEIFEVLGRNITRIGNVSAGQTAKVANQIIVGLTIQAVSEALFFAERAGADPGVVRQALLGGFASSKILEIHGDRMVNRSFDPGFRIRLHRKDLSLATQSATALDIALPNTALTQQLMNAAISRGEGELDHSALIQTLELLAGQSTPNTHSASVDE